MPRTRFWIMRRLGVLRDTRCDADMLAILITKERTPSILELSIFRYPCSPPSDCLRQTPVCLLKDGLIRRLSRLANTWIFRKKRLTQNREISVSRILAIRFCCPRELDSIVNWVLKIFAVRHGLRCDDHFTGWGHLKCSWIIRFLIFPVFDEFPGCF